MLHILLTTLKVIGILIGITLGLILSLLLIVLFVPIRYKGRVQNTDIVARITWLFHIISITLDYKEKNFKYVIKILGITISKDKKKSKHKENKSKDSEVEKKDSAKDKVIKEEEKSSNTEAKIEEKPKKDVKESIKEATQEKAKNRKSISQKLSEAINNINFKIRNICDKIINIKNKISDYKDFLTTDEARANIKGIFKLVFDLLVYILPTRLKGYIKFGMDNPETTGKTLGVISMFYGLYGGKLELEPDFENKVFEADIQFKGRIRLYRVLIVAFNLWRNEWLKKLMKFVKTH